jgi:hypothetical protein
MVKPPIDPVDVRMMDFGVKTLNPLPLHDASTDNKTTP